MRFHTPTALRERALLALAALFVTCGALTLSLCPLQPSVCGSGLPARTAIFALLGWLLCFATAHVTLCRVLPERDPLLLPVAALLSGWGLLEIGRLAPPFMPRQTTWLMLSTLAMLVIATAGRDLRWLRRFRYTWLFAGLFLLALTFLAGVNPSGQGPRLWLSLGGAFLQPSEPLKLLMVVFLASYLAERRDLILGAAGQDGRMARLSLLAYGGPLLAMFGLTLLLLAWQQDLGSAMLFCFTFLALLYMATGRWGYLAAGLLLFLVAGGAGYALSARVASRVDGWLNPWPGAADRAFQIVQSLIAFGTGGLGGRGLGLGRPTFIPAVHTDFVFAAIGEEFGLMGVVGLVALYGVLLLRGFRAALRTPRSFDRLLAAGLSAGLAIQAWIIMGANARLVPIAGVPLPFLSYGGSSLLVTFLTMGLLLRISAAPAEVPASLHRLDERPFLRVAATLALGLALLVALCGYWMAARGEWLQARGDNPRRVEYEQRILRGQILDRDGVELAGLQVGPTGLVTRTYSLPAAAPVIGYASLRYGTGGVEAAFDDLLRGEVGRSSWEAVWADLLHRPPQGGVVRLTLDADLQVQAMQVLAGQRGAVVLLDAETGDVLAMASSPTFDPARLKADWDLLRANAAAPLLNRATQGLYQPGAALETVVLAEALSQGTLSLSDPLSAVTTTLRVDGVALTCLGQVSDGGDWASAYRAACPGPFAALGAQMGEEALRSAVVRWGLTSAPSLEIPTEAGEWASRGAALEAVGQGGLTVSPLQMAQVAAVLANEGRTVPLRLVSRLEDHAGRSLPLGSRGEAREVVSPEIAHALLLAWSPYEEDVLGHLATAVVGRGGLPHAWFMGVAPAAAPRYVVTVLVEYAVDPEWAAEAGTALLRAALAHEGD